ncbi:agmatine deiminase family protein [Marinoscillum furvescens]|uniref:Agmatine deiminase n=1 Tax=Marinoscillum furvescens DSM 4134 TaxID=1122208 RepID=A0A3D9L089_MARFU|nr:agmatine deiminase family protein [Marinoscillum furvescens]RED96589.1 agmatine deiminase [Marinoscillum furvescens DSM 4134]
MSTPKADGLRFPAEWHPHRATWLSWPHNTNSWPGKIESIYKPYCEFIREVAKGEEVCINLANATMEKQARNYLTEVGADLSKIKFYQHPTNDAWCRDHGPAFVIGEGKKAIVNWGYNAWGEKYPPYDLDNKIPELVGGALSLPVYQPGIVMEGGSVDFNDEGIILTTTACLLNPNRNPQLNQAQIESYLKDYYGAKEIWWIGDGIVGDDTDGHVDDITRFVSNDTVVTVVEPNEADENHAPLAENLELLKGFQLADGTPLKVVELPMPAPVVYEGQRLPASYANFYIANECVVMPTYRDKKHDGEALEILQSCFTDRVVIGIDSTDIVWGLGSFHCLSQQEPKH